MIVFLTAAMWIGTILMGYLVRAVTFLLKFTIKINISSIVKMSTLISSRKKQQQQKTEISFYKTGQKKWEHNNAFFTVRYHNFCECLPTEQIKHRKSFGLRHHIQIDE